MTRPDSLQDLLRRVQKGMVEAGRVSISGCRQLIVECCLDGLVTIDIFENRGGMDEQPKQLLCLSANEMVKLRAVFDDVALKLDALAAEKRKLEAKIAKRVAASRLGEWPSNKIGVDYE